eukprot:2375461-Rhodomonas_salina.1
METGGGDEHLDVVAERLVVGVEEERALEVHAPVLERPLPAVRGRPPHQQPQRELRLVRAGRVQEPQRDRAVVHALAVLLQRQPARRAVRQRLRASYPAISARVPARHARCSALPQKTCSGLDI